MFHYIGGIPAVAWSVALAVGNGPKAFLEDREALVVPPRCATVWGGGGNIG
jgi:hypothetical protein